MAGGIDLAFQDLDRLQAAHLADAAHPQDGVHLQLVAFLGQLAEVHGVGGVQQHDDRRVAVALVYQSQL